MKFRNTVSEFKKERTQHNFIEELKTEVKRLNNNCYGFTEN